MWPTIKAAIIVTRCVRKFLVKKRKKKVEAEIEIEAFDPSELDHKLKDMKDTVDNLAMEKIYKPNGDLI